MQSGLNKHPENDALGYGLLSLACSKVRSAQDWLTKDMDFLKFKKVVTWGSIIAISAAFVGFFVPLALGFQVNPNDRLDFQGAAGVAGFIASLATIIIASIALYAYLREEDDTFQAAEGAVAAKNTMATLLEVMSSAFLRVTKNWAEGAGSADDADEGEPEILIVAAKSVQNHIKICMYDLRLLECVMRMKHEQFRSTVGREPKQNNAFRGFDNHHWAAMLILIDEIAERSKLSTDEAVRLARRFSNLSTEIEKDLATITDTTTVYKALKKDFRPGSARSALEKALKTVDDIEANLERSGALVD